MTQTFTWTGAAYNDWFTPSDWSPSGPPTAGSVALIQSNAGPQLDAAETVDNVGIVLGAGNSKLVLNGGTLGAAAAVTQAASYYRSRFQVLAGSAFDATFGFAPSIVSAQLEIYGPSGETLTIGQSATLTANLSNGIILESATVTNDGTLNAAGGLVSLYSGALDGTGVINISNGGYFFTNQDVGAGQTISFADQTGLLDVYNHATLAGPITNFQPGDAIGLGGLTADDVSYDATTHTLAVTDQGTTVASFNLFTNGSSIDFRATPDEFGNTVITSSDATRVWNGGTADWYDAANWTSTPSSPASFPLAGDTVHIDSGVASITAADVLKFGTINSEDIILTGSSSAPTTLSIDNGLIGSDATIELDGHKQAAVLDVRGNVTDNGFIAAHAQTGTMSIRLEAAGTLTADPSASVVSGTSTALNIEGDGTFVNNGIVVAQGGMIIDSNVTFTATASNSGNNEMIRLEHGGHVTINGTFENNAVFFGDSSGYLTIGNLANFHGQIDGMTGGNRIDLDNLVVDSVDYDSNTDTLTLLNAGTQVGQLTVFTSDGFSGFSVKSDNHGGSVISYEPTIKVLQPALPVPLVAAPGTQESLQDLLTQAFGTIPAAYADATFGLSYMTKADLHADVFSYWNLADKTVTDWQLNGTVLPGLPVYPYMPPNPPTTVVPGSMVAGITLNAGNAIMPGALLTVPVGTTSTAAFYIPTVNPGVASPTIYSGIVNPTDIVASAERFADFYVNVVNSNDCGWIGDDVAAAAGATMPSLDWSTDPSANVSGGFWRIVYRGSDQANPIQNWSTLVEPGDIVRMGWQGGGQHTTTVLAKNPDGSIEVYDNIDEPPGATASVIGIHDATYWTDTIPASVTIYRLDPNHQFLVNGDAAGQYLQGSPYSNLFQPIGGGDTIATGAEANEVAGTSANIDASSILGWMPGDSIDLTDLAVSGATYTYSAASGILSVDNVFSRIHADITLTAGLTYGFQLSADATGTGTLVTVACFASGTRLRTMSGDVAVEQLAVGDVLLTHAGIGRPIRWIGRRTIDLRGHPKPRDVQPVRIAAHAFGPRQPQRPLLLSPDHAVYFDGALIPVRYLIDGRRIVQLRRKTVTYWHVELDRHDVILAENLAAESYLDTGDRSDFAARLGSASWVWESEGCAPLTVTGPKVAAARRLGQSIAAP